MSLQDKLDAFKADFEGKKAPPHVVAVMHKATADLIASGQAERALKAGAKAPISRCLTLTAQRCDRPNCSRRVRSF